MVEFLVEFLVEFSKNENASLPKLDYYDAMNPAKNKCTPIVVSIKFSIHNLKLFQPDNWNVFHCESVILGTIHYSLVEIC